MRQFEGQIVVVADSPFSLLRVTRKHWLQLITAVQRERARTLIAARIAELSQELSDMKTLRFVAKTPQDTPSGQVFFMTHEEAISSELHCRTLYLTCALAPAKRQELADALPRNALLVEYSRQSP
jgi:glutathione synthase/RimK-type ligase-like ATP-grasp enzyme